MVECKSRAAVCQTYYYTIQETLKLENLKETKPDLVL